MIKKFAVVFAFILQLAFVSKGESTNRIEFPITGFSMKPLETAPGEIPQQAVMMFLPASDGFAANVNVQIQPYAKSLEDYVKLTMDQFKSMDMTVIGKKTPSKSVVVFEYTGELRGQSLHWYARAEKSGDSVYLATATATATQWDKVSAQLKSCVDSMRCTGAGKESHK